MPGRTQFVFHAFGTAGFPLLSQRSAIGGNIPAKLCFSPLARRARSKKTKKLHKHPCGFLPIRIDHGHRSGGANKPCFAEGRLAQLVERLVYTEDVGGSSPSSPTISPETIRSFIPIAPHMFGDLARVAVSSEFVASTHHIRINGLSAATAPSPAPSRRSTKRPPMRSGMRINTTASHSASEASPASTV